MRSKSRYAVMFSLALLAAGLYSPLALKADPPEAAPAATFAEPAAAGEPATPKNTSKSLLTIIRDGGMVMFPLLLSSFVLTVFIFERAISLRRGRVIPGPFVKRFLHQLKDGQLDKDQALALCDGNGSTAARIFAAAVRKWGQPSAEVEKAITDAGERAMNELRRYLRVFNGVATITPLLGLLGTVFGIIRLFSDIATSNAMGRPELLAKGISEALFTTATGLSIAIPALTMYWFFVSRVDRLLVDLDAMGQEVVGVISGEAIAEAGQTKPTRTRRSTSAAA